MYVYLNCKAGMESRHETVQSKLRELTLFQRWITYNVEVSLLLNAINVCTYESSRFQVS